MVIIRYQHKCIMCKAGKYRSALDAKCLDCPIHSTSLQNSTSMQDCTCLPGYQHATNPMGPDVSCVECSAGYSSAGPWPSRLVMSEGMIAVKEAESLAHEKTGLGKNVLLSVCVSLSVCVCVRVLRVCVRVCACMYECERKREKRRECVCGMCVANLTIFSCSFCEKRSEISATSWVFVNLYDV